MIKINQDICIGCGACVQDCLAGNLILMNGKAAALGECILCAHCAAICPQNAVTIPGYDMDDIEEYNPATFALDPVHFLHAVKFRRSVRRFLPKGVEHEKLEMLLQAGRYTATAKNTQNCRFIIVRENLSDFKKIIWDGIGRLLSLPDGEIPETIRPFRSYYETYCADPDYDFLFRNAPALCFIAANHTIDAGLAAQNMEMTAVSLGLGVLYNGYLVRAAVQNPEALEWLGAGSRPLAACMLVGYPAVSYRRTAPRRKADIIWR